MDKTSSPDQQTTSVLLTAFGPFPGIPVNATALLVPRLAARSRRAFAGRPVAVHTVTLPTEWRRGPDRAEAAIRRLRPDIVVHFGVSSKAGGFVLETVARSACVMQPDAAGERPATSSLGRAATLRASLPIRVIGATLAAAGLAVETSEDAGGYLCNAVLYRTLALPADVRPLSAGFVHIPAGLAGHGADGREAAPRCALDHAGFLTGGVHIVATCIEALCEARAIV